MKETYALHGHFDAVFKNSYGEVFEIVEKDNLIVNLGYDLVLNSAFRVSSRPSPATYIAIGSGGTAPDAAEQVLVTPIGVRQASSFTQSDYPTNNFCKLSYEFTGIDNTIAEAGLFNAVTSGTMFDRVKFSGIPVTPGDSITATFTITIS
jgi:hypothetical protein